MGIAFDDELCKTCSEHHHLYYPGGEEAYGNGKTLKYTCPKMGSEVTWRTDKWYRIAKAAPENAVLLRDL